MNPELKEYLDAWFARRHREFDHLMDALRPATRTCPADHDISTPVVDTAGDVTELMTESSGSDKLVTAAVVATDVSSSTAKAPEVLQVVHDASPDCIETAPAPCSTDCVAQTSPVFIAIATSDGTFDDEANGWCACSKPRPIPWPSWLRTASAPATAPTTPTASNRCSTYCATAVPFPAAPPDASIILQAPMSNIWMFNGNHSTFHGYIIGNVQYNPSRIWCLDDVFLMLKRCWSDSQSVQQATAIFAASIGPERHPTGNSMQNMILGSILNIFWSNYCSVALILLNVSVNLFIQGLKYAAHKNHIYIEAPRSDHCQEETNFKLQPWPSEKLAFLDNPNLAAQECLLATPGVKKIATPLTAMGSIQLHLVVFSGDSEGWSNCWFLGCTYETYYNCWGAQCYELGAATSVLQEFMSVSNCYLHFGVVQILGTFVCCAWAILRLLSGGYHCAGYFWMTWDPGLTSHCIIIFYGHERSDNCSFLWALEKEKQVSESAAGHAQHIMLQSDEAEIYQFLQQLGEYLSLCLQPKPPWSTKIDTEVAEGGVYPHREIAWQPKVEGECFDIGVHYCQGNIFEGCPSSYMPMVMLLYGNYSHMNSWAWYTVFHCSTASVVQMCTLMYGNQCSAWGIISDAFLKCNHYICCWYALKSWSPLVHMVSTYWLLQEQVSIGVAVLDMQCLRIAAPWNPFEHNSASPRFHTAPARKCPTFQDEKYVMAQTTYYLDHDGHDCYLDAFLDKINIDHKHFPGFDCDCANKGCFFVAFFIKVSINHNNYFDTVCSDITSYRDDYDGDSNKTKEVHMPWDPGKSSFKHTTPESRLGDKPSFKEGGMLGLLLPWLVPWATTWARPNSRSC